MKRAFLCTFALLFAAGLATAGKLSLTAYAGFGANRQYGTNYETTVSDPNVTVETIGALNIGGGLRYAFLPWLAAELDFTFSATGGGTTYTAISTTFRYTQAIAHLPLLAVFSWAAGETGIVLTGKIGPSLLLRTADSQTYDLIVGGSTTTTDLAYAADDGRVAFAATFAGGVEFTTAAGILYGGIRGYRTFTSMDPPSTAVADRIYYGGFIFEAGYRLPL